jgi:hypothetical protein
MKKLSETIGTELVWAQPSARKMDFELRTREDLAAVLRFRSAFGTLATAESADGCWTFKRVGFWQTRVSIRTCSAEAELASFKNNTWSGGGSLEFPDGRRVLATTNFWQSKYRFQTEPGETLVRYNTSGILHLSAEMVIEPAALAYPELPWIPLLGWYLVVMLYMDSASTIAATTSI